MRTSADAHELELIKRAAVALKQSAGVPMHLLVVADTEADALIEINSHVLLVKVKSALDRVSSLRDVQQQLRRIAAASGYPPEHTVLVTGHLTEKLLATCRELKLNAVDASGNAHLAWNDTLISVSGRPRDRLYQSRIEDRRGWTSTAVRLGLVALATPEALSAPQRVIAARTGVSLGSVGSTIEWLESRRFLARRQSGVSVIRRNELLAEWTIQYSSRLRPRLNVQRFKTNNEPGQWGTAVIAPGLWSGEVAAALHHGNLRPSTAELYVDRTKRHELVRLLVGAFQLRPDPDGAFTVLDRFWTFDTPQSKGTVPWPVIYADLLHIGDPRTDEAAMMIKQDAS